MVSVLFTGYFTTTISATPTRVDIKIYMNYEVHAVFKCMGETYTFKLMKWMKTKEGTTNATSTFNKFAQLMIERYGDASDMFGKNEQQGNDGISMKLVITNEQINNILKYATIEVFQCAEEIIQTYKRSLLDYCIYHREHPQFDTYEKYIHLMACHCLVHSNFFAPGISFNPVAFCSAERTYNHAMFKSLHSIEVEEGGDS